MSDEQTIDSGSETSGETATETSQEGTAAETTEASTEKSDETAADTGGAAEQTPETGSETSGETLPTDASRTGFAEKGLRAGDACICPDGRKGTVHQYDAGLICMPNQDQG